MKILLFHVFMQQSHPELGFRGYFAKWGLTMEGLGVLS
jgi:hypothetical protein